MGKYIASHWAFMSIGFIYLFNYYYYFQVSRPTFMGR